MGSTNSSAKIQAGKPPESSFVPLKRSFTQTLLLPLTLQCQWSQLHVLHRPQPAHHHLLQGFLCRLFEDTDTRVEIWWWSTCVLTIYSLFLLFLMFSTFLCDYFFLCCLSFIELVNANHFWDVINLLPADKMSVRQERAWVLACVLWARTTCSQQSCPAVHAYSCNKQVNRRVADLHFKTWKKNNLKLWENWDKRKGVLWCFVVFFFFPQSHVTAEKDKGLLTLCCRIYWIALAKPSHCVVSLTGQSRFLMQNFPKFPLIYLFLNQIWHHVIETLLLLTKDLEAKGSFQCFQLQ